jgi:hypothetical protein
MFGISMTAQCISAAARPVRPAHSLASLSDARSSDPTVKVDGSSQPLADTFDDAAWQLLATPDPFAAAPHDDDDVASPF